MLAGELTAAAVTLAEAQGYVRIETGEEEAILAGLICTASAMCEQFTGRVILARGFSETLSACGEWQKLSLTPVRSIDAVEAIGEDGTASPLAAGDYAIDVDSAGDGWMDEVESPQDPSAHGYRVKITGASATIERDCNEPQTTFTPSQVASLGSGPIEIEVRQIGALALSRPQSITINS